MPVSSDTLGALLRQSMVLGRAVKSLAGREPVPGVRMAGVFLLSALNEAGEIRGSVLAERLGVDVSVVSRQLAELDGLGLTGRRPDPADGRAWLCRVTPKGLDVLEHLRAERLQLFERALAGWDEADARALLDRLTRLEHDLMTALHQDQHHDQKDKVLT